MNKIKFSPKFIALTIGLTFVVITVVTAAVPNQGSSPFNEVLKALGLIEAKLDKAGPGVAKIEAKLDRLAPAVERLEAKLDKAGPGVAQIEAKLDKMQDHEGHMIEIHNEIKQLEAKLDQIEAKLDRIQ